MLDEDIPALIPAAIVITLTFLALLNALLSSSTQLTQYQVQRTRLATADSVWEKLSQGQAIACEGDCNITITKGPATLYTQSCGSTAGLQPTTLSITYQNQAAKMTIRGCNRG